MSTLKDRAAARLPGLSDRVLRLSHRLHAHPEVAWEEHRAARWVAEELNGLGYTVEPEFCGLPTAFRARIGGGPLNVAICAEYDALPGLGHACGHNVIAAAAVGAAGVLADLVDEAGLTVTVLGTPAEEGGGGKILMLDRGGFDGVHAAMMVHPGPLDVARAQPFAVAHNRIRYHGLASHAAAYPEYGRNAADAFTVAQTAIGLLRQHLGPGTRVHGIVTRGGEAPNAIPELTEGRWYVRAENLADLAELETRVNRCFEAGALATDCRLEVEPESPPYADFVTDEDLLALYVGNATALGREFPEPSAASRMNRASTDMGNVSHRVPAIHPYLGIDSLPAVNHQKEFAAHCAGPAADRAVLDGALAMAWTCLDLAALDDLRGRLLKGGA